MESMTKITKHSSIHYQRRWFYVLWTILLLASCCFLLFWNKPYKAGYGQLTIILHIKEIPDGTQIKTWIGPKNNWPKTTKKFIEASINQYSKNDSAITIGPLKVFVAYRRWIHSYIPRGSDDFVVITFIPKLGPAKYITLSLSDDINSGYFAPPRRMTEIVTNSWFGMDLLPGSPIDAR